MPPTKSNEGHGMKSDIFEFWAGLHGHVTTHPADEQVLDRVNRGFERDCLVSPYLGNLKSAPVVLLFLSPGCEEVDRTHARSEDAWSYYTKQRSGKYKLPSHKEHSTARNWA